MYEHKILCLFQSMRKTMKKMTKKNEKHGYFIQMMKKNDDRRKNRQTLQPRPTEDDGKIFGDISDEK